MAFAAAGFVTVISGGGASGTGDGSVKQIHHYATTDAKAVVEASGYFDSQADKIRKGDVIVCATALGGTPALRMVIVTSDNYATPVTVAAQDVA